MILLCSFSDFRFGCHSVKKRCSTKVRGENYSKAQLKDLEKWAEDHLHYPYPSHTETKLLADRTGLQEAQVKQWFINARRNDPKRIGAITKMQKANGIEAKKAKHTLTSDKVSREPSIDTSARNPLLPCEQRSATLVSNVELTQSSAFHIHPPKEESCVTVETINLCSDEEVMKSGATPTAGKPASKREVAEQMICSNNVKAQDCITYGNSGNIPTHANNGSQQPLSLARQRLTPHQFQTLVGWVKDHIEHPYPTAEETKKLVQKTKLSEERIEKWFSNGRGTNPDRIITRMQKEARQTHTDMEADVACATCDSTSLRHSVVSPILVDTESFSYTHCLRSSVKSTTLERSASAPPRRMNEQTTSTTSCEEE